MTFAWESGARSYCRSIPNIFSHAEGCRLYDESGKAYIDFLTGAGTLVLGHNHPAIRKTIAGLENPLMNHLDLRTSSERAFAETLLPVLPFSRKDEVKLHFCGSTGSDAVEAALKLAVIKTGRRRIFSFMGSYHGMSQGALAITSSVHQRQAGLRVQADVTFLPFPYPYRFPAPFNTEDSATDFCLAQLRLLLEDDHSGTDLPAAIIIEPVQGEGGVVPAPARFLKELRAICDRHDIVLIFDEIQAGLGRCGAMFSCQLANVEPDIICLSKGIGGGFPMALIAYRREMDAWKPGDHIGTYRGQQFAMACGKALIETIVNDNLAENAAKQGQFLMEGLKQIGADTSDMVGEVRGRGLYIGVELDKNLSEPGVLVKAVQKKMLEKGIVMGCGGRRGGVLRLLPPLIIDRQIADEFLDKFAESMKEVSRDMMPNANHSKAKAA